MTFCIGTCNNLNYLKLAIHSVRTYSHFKDAPFIIFAENCNDGTYEWLNEVKGKYNLTVLIEDNDEKHTKGIGGGMNECAKHVKTEYIMFLHADMFVSKNWDLEALKIFKKYPNEKMWVFSYRFQPNIFTEDSRPGTLMFSAETFGYKHDDFQENYFIQYAEEFSRLNPNLEIKKGEGVSGLIRKIDWDFIGGNDPRFAPAYWEDCDIFIRIQLAKFRIILTSNSIVFHFASRSDKSNFPTDDIATKCMNESKDKKFRMRSAASLNYERRGAQRFFEKWGFWPVHTDQQFVTLPTNIDQLKLQHLIQIK